MEYQLKIDENAVNDIENAVQYYQNISSEVMNSFHKSLRAYFQSILLNPFFQIRYGNYRCLPLKKFPFMIHYVINEETSIILILGVINTYRNPAEYYIK